MRPRILVSSFLREGYTFGPNFKMPSSYDYGMVSQNYVNGVLEGGGVPLVSPQIRKYYDDDQLMEDLVDSVDGIVLTGGYDVDPAHYKKHAYKKVKFVDPIRDLQELKLVELALKKGKSILGICRGFQVLNVFFGGNLYQDINQDLETDVCHFGSGLPKYTKVHSVSLEKDSILEQIFKDNPIEVNSFHHQAVNKVGKGLKETAFSSDGILEGFESKEYENVWSVQWHPESMFSNHPEQLAIFREFIKRTRKSNKK